MIKNIIKRDGRVEPFDPNKVNGWGEWASQTLSGVDWGSVVLEASQTLPETTSSEDLQTALIETCIHKRTWNYNRMAGRLYSALRRKQIYGSDKLPTLRELHLSLKEKGLLGDQFFEHYSEDEYHHLNLILNHNRDFTYAHYQLKQLDNKYALKDLSQGKVYETPQFVYMRVAMRLAMNAKDKLHDAERFYYLISTNKLNVPTPYLVNAGTTNEGFISCCVYAVDDKAPSLAAGDHIAYMMTVASAGIGAAIYTRSIGEPVRGGLISHQGKLPYYRSLATAVGANLQNGRGGAATVTFSCYDPQIDDLLILKNPMTPPDRGVREIDYSMAYNAFFARKAARNEDYHLLSYRECPEVYAAIASGDEEAFEREYNKAVEEGKSRGIRNARTILLAHLQEAVETGRQYNINLTEANRHTPFKDPIHSSNLCQEIQLSTKPYQTAEDLYKEDHERGEVALCALAGIVPQNIESDEEYAEAAYYALKMVDAGIDGTEFPLPHIGYCARNRRSAGVSIVGLAHYLAKRNLSYASQEGRNAIHELFETHYWHLANASLRIAEESGNAPWIGKSKWVDGWLPIDTYNRNVDTLVTVANKRDWEGLRARIKKQGGIAHTTLTTALPAESSSIASATTNGVYPVRSKHLLKTNGTGSLLYVVPESETLNYESAWDLPSEAIIQTYAIIQKWTDQGISADLWLSLIGNQKVSSKKLLDDFFLMYKLGCKTRYYVNSRTSKEISLGNDDDKCAGGFCTL